MRAGLVAESGIAAYGAAPVVDWVPQLDCVRSHAAQRPMVVNIAFALGRPSSQHFATTFRKHIGATPSDWRKAKQA